MPSNTAAWFLEEKKPPATVKEAPYTSPKADDILVKNEAVRPAYPTPHFPSSIEFKRY